ncbi:protein kinase family protein [Nocardiopsis sp. N85]|uniref:protein kinase family protein n=1 Tax=Nocardiopsis sp. N85 TaxID=3029400 RepID=UPI00237F537B|nr:protein kinase family protein [Nocardiopsis sp. N85]MDE3723060.1 protein kinase family protein [Nocardiopsis sp. N85]
MDPLHPHDPPAIGPFRLLGRLSEDADVRRYLAEGEDGTGATLAVARPGRATDPAFRASFARRIAAVRGAAGPHLCPIVAAEPHGAVPWAAAARPAGDTLADLLERDDGTVRDRPAPIAVALARGLAELHAAGAAYGPFTARDVLIGEDGAVLAGPVPGAEADGAAEDVRAWAELLVSAAGEKGVPLWLRRLVDLCLHPDPALRPSAADLVRMLGEPASDTDAPPAREGRRPRRRWPALLAGGLVLAVVAATAVSSRDRAEPEGGGADAAGAPPPGCPGTTAFPPPEDMPDGFSAHGAAFSPDGDVLAVSAYQHGITLWDWREKTPIAYVSEPNHYPQVPVFAPRGCAVGVLEYVGEGEPRKKAVVYDLVTGTVTDLSGRRGEEPFDRAEPDTSFVTFSPDGRVAVGTPSWDGPENDVRLFDPGATEPALVLDSGGSSRTEFMDGDRLAVGHGDSVTVWDLEGGERLHTVRPSTATEFAYVPGTDDIVHVNGDRVVRWNVVERTEVASFDLSEHAEREYEDLIVIALSLDPVSERVFIAWGGSVDGESRLQSDVWDMATGEDVLPEDAPSPYRVAFHPDGGPIAAVVEYSVVLLDPDTFEEVDVLIP